VIYEPTQTGQFLPTPVEEAALRRAETDARQRAEAEAARLRQEVERLRPGTSSEEVG